MLISSQTFMLPTFLSKFFLSKLNINHPVIYNYTAQNIDDIEDCDVPSTQNRRAEYIRVPRLFRMEKY